MAELILLDLLNYIWHFIEKSTIFHGLGHTQSLKVVECAKVFFCFIFVLDDTGLLLATAVFKAWVLGSYALERNKELLADFRREYCLICVTHSKQGSLTQPSRWKQKLLRNVGNYDHIYMCMCVCVCVYIYIYIYVHTRAHKIRYSVTSQKTPFFINNSVTASDFFTLNCSLLKFKCIRRIFKYFLTKTSIFKMH
jgi:hypothetical protein